MKEKTFKGSGHLVLIGNSPFLPVVLEEISRSGFPDIPQLVILSTIPPSNDSTKAFLKKITVTQGETEEQAALERTSPHTAQGVLVNTYGEPEADEKALAITKLLLENCGVPPKKITLIVSNDTTQKKVYESYSEPPKIICVQNVFTRIIGQSSRQRFLTEVYEELFSFHGNEFYSIPAANFTGTTFACCLRLYANACPVGICTKNALTLNPPMNTVAEEDDYLVVLAPAMQDIRKNDTILPAPDLNALSQTTLGKIPSESFIFLGWNDLCPKIISRLDHYAPPGSQIQCYSCFSYDIPIFIPELKNCSIKHDTGEIFDREFLSNIPWEQFENIVLPGLNFNENDKTYELRNLLEEVLAERGFANNITTVLWHPQENPGDNFPRGTLSISLIFRMTAQHLFHDEFSRVVDDLTKTTDPEICLNPVENYVNLEKTVDFYTIIEAARNKNETAIGYVQDKKILLNPEKSARQQFNHFDRIIVLSNEQ